MELELERIPWRDCAVQNVVSYNSTRALQRISLIYEIGDLKVFFPQVLFP